MNKIEPVSLTEESFAAFGKIISVTEKAPACDDANIIYTKQVYTDAMGKLSTGIMTCKKRTPILQTMEKHENTPEIMVNLGGDAILVLAEKDYDFESDNADKIRAFRVKKGDAYVIDAGVWHWASYPVKEERVDYLVIFKFDTEDTDIINGSFRQPLEINMEEE